MASGDDLCYLSAEANLPPSTAYAAIAGSANGDLWLDFNASGDVGIMRALMPRNYAGGGVTALLHWTVTTTSTGTVGWALYFERGNDANNKVSVDGFGSCQIVVPIVSTATCYQLTTSSLAIASGTALNNVTAGDIFRLKITPTSSDSNTGHRRLVAVELKET